MKHAEAQMLLQNSAWKIRKADHGHSKMGNGADRSCWYHHLQRIYWGEHHRPYICNTHPYKKPHFCNIAEKFDHDLDHQPILLQCTLLTVNNPPNSRLSLRKMDVFLLKKTLTEELAHNQPSTSINTDKLDKEIYSLISAINKAILAAIPRARLCPKSILRLDENCKKFQMKARRLEKM